MAESIFSMLRSNRLEDSEPEEIVIDESVEETEESSEEQEVVEDSSEEIVMVACPHCGILEALDESGESDIDVCPHCGEEDLIEKVVKVVRNGDVVKKKVKTKKTRLTAAQKQALAKARKKAHSASAEKSRAKSNKVRSKKGLNDADYVECAECGWTGDASELEDGCCPECGASIKDNSEKCGAKKKKACSESVNDVLEAISNMTEEDIDSLKEALKGE